MHYQSMNRMKYLLQWYEKYFNKSGDKIKILDVGSCSYLGQSCYRDIVNGNKYDYIGMDIVEGHNVDIVEKDIYSWGIKDNSYDVVISGQAFEHIEYPWLTIQEMARVVKPGGFCIITAPNAGVEHRYPVDCYRYYGDGLRALAKYAGLKVHHTSVAGMPNIESADEYFTSHNDAVLVAQKAPYIEITEEPFIYEQRHLLDGTADFTYVNDQRAVDIITKEFAGEKQIILFGAGKIGERALNAFGEDKVFCFADNNPRNELIAGKRVISFQEMKAIASDYAVVISNKLNYLEIKNQLNDNGISSKSFIYADDFILKRDIITKLIL